MDLDFNNGSSGPTAGAPTPGQAPQPTLPPSGLAAEPQVVAPVTKLSDVVAPAPGQPFPESSTAKPQPIAEPQPASVPAPTVESQPVIANPASDVVSNPPEDFQPVPEQIEKGSGMLKIILLVIGIAIVGALVYLFLTDSGKALLGLSTNESEVTEIADLNNEAKDDSSLASDTPNTSQQSMNGSITNSNPSANPIAVRDTQRKDDLAKIKEALDKYYAAKGSYPISAQLIKTSDPSSVLASALVPSYLVSLPDDPNTPEYWYGYKSLNDTSYELTARLEDTTDLSGKIENSLFIYRISGTPTPVSQDNATTSGASSDFSSGEGS